MCDAIPIVLEEHKANPEDRKQREALLASVMKCLVATCAVASKDTFVDSNCAKSKQIVLCTNDVMRRFNSHPSMNRDGCLILQRVCKHLPKSERKRLGVVASLGSVVASESIDQDVKDIADEILEEQFK